jgi:carbon-monoxide dehydrogenase medium subunit
MIAQALESPHLDPRRRGRDAGYAVVQRAGALKPAPFEYVRARSLDEALAALDGDGKILAGGQSLVPMLNMRLVRPARLVDINAVPGLDAVRARPDGGLDIGALVRHTDLLTSPLVQARAPLLATAAAHVGHRAIRNRGTVGGSLAHADPAAELPAALLALDAGVVVAGRAGHRRLPLAELFVGLLTTALAPDEILTGIEIPDARAAGWGFAELARRAGDFAIAGVAAVVSGGPDRCTGARLVAFGADDRPVRLRAAEDAIVGRAASTGLAARAAAEAPRDCRPSSDVHASAEYRTHLVRVLAEDAVRDAVRRLPA